METLLRYNLPAVIVLLNNDSWGGRSIGHDQYYPKMDSWDMMPNIRYDRMFAALGCHTEYVVEPGEIRPALYHAFNSGVPSLINVRAEATTPHPLRARMNLVDVWTRENLDELPEEAVAELRQFSPMVVKRAEKMYRDFGLHIPIQELAEIVGAPIEDVLL